MVERPRDEREAALRTQTDDPSLIADVMALCLSHDRDSTTQFSQPLNAMIKGAAAPELKTGDTLGVWKIDREIGHGGMGSVFLVERGDGHFTQTAALKFVKGLPRTDSFRYFSRERQLLATLTHPNIARLLDGGATSGGQPYLVMEYIDGIAIDVYCRQNKLDTTQVLRLFTTACSAVAFAHRQLVIHCDLKPSNLLINREGRPILLDFGIARLIDRVGAHAEDAAIGSSVAYTPRYASPEQREHGIVSTVSDIYSLGIMLGELLDIAGKPDEELKAVLAKATAQEPAKRYATVDALTDDIGRYLQKFPLQAMPQAPAYRTRKFLQRRWPLVLVGLAFAATIVGFTLRVIGESQRAQSAEKSALTERDRAQAAEQQAMKERDTTQVARAEALRERDGAARERDRATEAERVAAAQRNLARTAEASAVGERDRAKAAERAAIEEKNKATQAELAARQTSEFLVSIFDNSNPNAESGDIPASKLLTAAEEKLDKELKGQPGTQAELYSTMGQVRNNMGQSDQALKNLDRAVEIERTLNRPKVLARALLRQGDAYGNYDADKSLAAFKEALELHEKHSASDSAELGEALVYYGNMLSETGKREDGAPLLRRGLAIHEKIDPNSFDTANSTFNLGLNRERSHDYKAALELYDKALAIRVPRNGAGHPEVLRIQERYGLTLVGLQRYEEAVKVHTSTLAYLEKLHGRVNSKVAKQRIFLAGAVVLAGRPFEAVPMFEEAIDVMARTSGKGTSDYLLALNNFALAQYQMGDYAAAAPLFIDVLTGARKLFGEDGDAVATINRNCGRALYWQGKYGEAIPYLEEGVRLFRKNRGENSTDAADSLISLAAVASESGRTEQAIAILKKMEPMLPLKNNALQSQVERIRAMVAEQQGRFDEALRGFELSEELMSQATAPNSYNVWMTRLFRAEYLYRRGTAESRAAAAALSREIVDNASKRWSPKSLLFARMKRLQTP